MTSPQRRDRRFFASDNAAGVHPTLLEAIHRANTGHALAYGHDEWTAAATARIREMFKTDAEVLFVFGGTGANVVGLRTTVDSYQSVLCPESSHLWRDECAAPERFLGCKIVPIPTADGKLRPDDVRPHLPAEEDIHHAQPGAISVSQSTEWGTVYQPDDLRALASVAHRHGMWLHVDGARLANAAVALDVSLGTFGPELGIDVMTLGGTKLGMLAGEAVVIFNDALKQRAGYFQKQGTQLISKMRFVAAQFEALLTGDMWRTLASQANQMAGLLGAELDSIEGVTLARAIRTNMVYARFPPNALASIQEAGGPFHCPTPDPNVGRLVTAWDTQPSDVATFVAVVKEFVGRPRG